MSCNQKRITSKLTHTVGRLRASLVIGQKDQFLPCKPFPKATDNMAADFSQME